MRLWNKIKQIILKKMEKAARREVVEFMRETASFRMDFPENLKRRKERIAYKQNLTETYTYQEGDDLLSKKQDFINQYTVNEQEQRQHFTAKFMGATPMVRCKAWRDHEQIERFQAQKNWHQVVHRNTQAHMLSKFMNQQTR